jgi:hypothetical protein
VVATELPDVQHVLDTLAVTFVGPKGEEDPVRNAALSCGDLRAHSSAVYIGCA